MLGMHMGRVPAPSAAEDAVAESGERATFDTEDWLQLINRASIVANVEAGLLDRENAGKLARALDDMRREGEKPGAKRAELYITFEPELLRRAGMAASVLHVGRSSQDILATANAGLNLERLVKILAALSEVRRALWELADREQGAVVPAYTNGVQAQPTLYSHYLLAQISVFGRDVERAFECIRRFDFCPMGSTVLNGTGWPLRVERMAELLGFSRALANAFDAGQCAGNDLPLEMSQIVTAAMLHVNAFLADFMVQYATPHPWIRMESTNGEYRSSSMPQKRNPSSLEHCRPILSKALAEAQAVFTVQHNTPYGDIVDSEEDLQIHLYDAVSYLNRALEIITNVLATMQINKELLRKRAGENFITATELADTFVREGGLTFRKAHKLTSAIVRRLYAEGKGAEDITEDFCETISKEVLGYPVDLSDEAIRTALDPVHFVAIRERTGGPALSQVSRMHRERLAMLQQERRQLEEIRGGYHLAHKRLAEQVEKHLKKD